MLSQKKPTLSGFRIQASVRNFTKFLHGTFYPLQIHIMYYINLILRFYEHYIEVWTNFVLHLASYQTLLMIKNKNKINFILFYFFLQFFIICAYFDRALTPFELKQTWSQIPITYKYSKNLLTGIPTRHIW